MFTLEVIGAGVHQLVLQHVSMGQTGEYRSPDFILSFWVWVFHNLTSRCQVTLDEPPFHFLSASSSLTVMVLPERLPVISGLSTKPDHHPSHLGYLPGDKLAINCTAGPSHPGASLTWLVNRRKVDKWMVTSYLPITYPSGLTSSVLGLNFLVLAEHFRGPERELWATCRSSMLPIKGVEMPVERSLLLGRLNRLAVGHSHRLKAGMLKTSPNIVLMLIVSMVFTLWYKWRPALYSFSKSFWNKYKLS